MFWAIPLYRRRPACSVASVCGPIAWRCRLRRGFPLALPACRRPCSPVALSVAVPCSGGAVSVASGGCFAVRGSPAKVSGKISGKVSGKVAKVAGIVVRLRAKVAGKVAVKVASACAKVAHFTSKS